MLREGGGDVLAQADAQNLGIVFGPEQRFGSSGQRDASQQQRQREKRARCRGNKKSRKAEEQSSANLASGLKRLKVQVVVDGNVVADTRKRAITTAVQPTPESKKSRLQDSKLAQSLANYFDNGVNQLSITGPRSLNFFHHGPIPISTLRQYARSLRGIHEDTVGVPFNHPTDVLRNADGLVVLQLDSRDLSTVSQVEVSLAERSGTEGSTFEFSVTSIWALPK